MRSKGFIILDSSGEVFGSRSILHGGSEDLHETGVVDGVLPLDAKVKNLGCKSVSGSTSAASHQTYGHTEYIAAYRARVVRCGFEMTTRQDICSVGGQMTHEVPRTRHA